MRKASYLLLSLVVAFSACTSSQKLLEKGRYDQAVQKSVEKLRKKPNDTDELNVLKEAYSQANMFDKERIDFLERENHEDNYMEIYNLYTRLENRQDVIRSLPSRLRTQFNLVDYDDEIIRSKESAAEAAYQQGLQYLDRGDRQSARMAYQEFVKVSNLYRDYKNVRRLLNEARYLGTNYVLLRVENNSDKVLPEDFDTELRKISLAELDTEWLRYETVPDTTMRYDYYVVINIRNIDVSPESVEKRTYTDSKEVQDGMKYVLDQNGNVAKDSLGNDIREPNMVTISAEVTESVQQKRALVGGSIDYVDLQTNQLMKTEEISVEAVFQHYSAVASGDEDALTDASYQKVRNSPIPFPSNEAMLMDAAQKLKERAKVVIYQNRGLLTF